MAAKKSTPASETPEPNETVPNETVPVVATVEADETGPNAVAVVEPVEIVVEDETEAPAAPQVVYVPVPAPPKKKGNRGVGALIAIAGAFVYAIVLALVLVVMSVVATGRPNFGAVTNPNFFVPVALFALGLILVVLLVNRAGWWSYVIGSVVVALIVYFGTVGVILLLNGVILDTSQVASQRFLVGLLQPFPIVAGLIAREVAIWTGVLISVRGKKVKSRNASARETYAREEAERRAEAAAS
jgi:hypothetical protein